jgi:hypothetical protein
VPGLGDLLELEELPADGRAEDVGLRTRDAGRDERR